MIQKNLIQFDSIVKSSLLNEFTIKNRSAQRFFLHNGEDKILSEQIQILCHLINKMFVFYSSLYRLRIVWKKPNIDKYSSQVYR
jgi:hypothetical protein